MNEEQAKAVAKKITAGLVARGLLREGEIGGEVEIYIQRMLVAETRD